MEVNNNTRVTYAMTTEDAGGRKVMKKKMDKNSVFAITKLPDLAKRLDKELNPQKKKELGFALFVFPFGGAGVSNYVSNAAREDMILFIEETLERFKTGKVNERKAQFTNEQSHAILEFIKGLSKEEKKALLED